LDEDNSLIIGYFDNITGLSSDISETADEDCYNLSFNNFLYSDDFKPKCSSRRYFIRNLYILILDHSGNTIGNYYFVLNSRRILTSSDLRDGQDVNLVGYLPTALSMETLRLWDLSRDLKQNNIWIPFTTRQREIWLGVLRNRISSSFNIQEKTNQTYYLDGRYVTDKISFYFTLGESINGPGGYFGGCLDSLSDCLSGGFGVKPPFTLEINRMAHKLELIEKILEVLKEHNVTIIFKD
jgi:RNAse (barnase) inhibitor barstar